jgi:hypothetical protein
MTAPFPIDLAQARGADTPRSPALVAWVDGVGAFLLCFDDAISLGGLAGRADVRIAADLATEHANVKRSGEGYVVESTSPALVVSENSRRAGGVSPPSASRAISLSSPSKSTNRSALRGSGRVVVGQTDLNNGDELLLYREGGSGVRLRFCRPNVLTSTAVLTLASEHRTEPRFDGIVMFAEACVLGPNPDAHVRCKEWEESVLLFRREGELWAKSATPLSVGDKAATQLVRLHPGDYLSAPGISFRLEAP